MYYLNNRKNNVRRAVAALSICVMIWNFGISVAALSVPDGNTAFKSYMSYTAITNKESEQWQLQQNAVTDENGLRMVDGRYMVAVGSYYSNTIGEKIEIELEGGCRIPAIVGDLKADVHTDEKNQYRAVYDSDGNFISKNVVEFIVDMNTLDKKAKNWGDISAIEGFEGNVVGIYKIDE